MKSKQEKCYTGYSVCNNVQIKSITDISTSSVKCYLRRIKKNNHLSQ